MASCTKSKPPTKDGKGVASGTLRYLQERRSKDAYMAPGSRTAALEGVLNPDFLALGLGGTNLMAMLWAVAMGKRAVGVEMRGDPSLGVHWNIREDYFHQLGLVDRMMIHRYGEEGVPRRENGVLFSLADCFYSSFTKGGDVVPDNVIEGYDDEQHIVGTIQHVEYIDDRYKQGVPSRTVTELPPPSPPASADPMKIRGDMQDVLDGPSTFQASALAVQLLLRRYLEKMEVMDLEAGRFPRVRLFTQHRVVEKAGFGFVPQADGRYQVRIEEVTEMDFKGQTIRLRTPGSDIIDIGVPELWCIAQGANSSDAKRLGFEQADVQADHGDGRGPIVAQADYLAGLFELLVDGRLRRRIASHFDADGEEYWIRQIAVGHENDPEVAWVLVQVPDHMTFDPVAAGLVAPDTCESSIEYFAAYQILLQDFYLEQAALVLGMDPNELRKVEQVYGPKMFSLVEKMGQDARIAPNGVVAGDTFGNGHFMTSGGAMTGMVGHAFRFLEHWQRQAEGFDMELSVRLLADRIKNDTEAWLTVSAKEFTEALPVNFGAERAAQIAAASGIDPNQRASDSAVAREQRHGLIPLDPSDWRRLFLKNGRVLSQPLPPIKPDHPDLSEWLESHPESVAEDSRPEFRPKAGDVMMGAGQISSDSQSTKVDNAHSLEEQIHQLERQHYDAVNQIRTRGLSAATAADDTSVHQQRRPSFPLSGTGHAQPLDEAVQPAFVRSHSSLAGTTRSESPRPSYPRSHSSLSTTPANDAEKRLREMERLAKKMDMYRQREELYHQIASLNAQMPESPTREEYSEPSHDPASLVSKLLTTESSTPDSTRTLQRRSSASQLYSRASSESSVSTLSRPTSSRAGSSLSVASSRSSVRSPSPIGQDYRKDLAPMPEDGEYEEHGEFQDRQFESKYRNLPGTIPKQLAYRGRH